jgi:hypothetical protein
MPDTLRPTSTSKDIKGAILEGRLIVGSGKTVTMRRLQQQLKEENKITVSKSLTVEKHSIKLGTLIAALYYDLAADKQVQIPKQGEGRERELRELVRKNKQPVALFVDEAHDLSRPSPATATRSKTSLNCLTPNPPRSRRSSTTLSTPRAPWNCGPSFRPLDCPPNPLCMSRLVAVNSVLERWNAVSVADNAVLEGR